MLDREIDQAETKEDAIEFRKYLVRALGEFDVEDGTDVLLKAAKTNRDPSRPEGARRGDPSHRRAGLQFVEAESACSTSQPPNWNRRCLQLAADTDPVIRFQTAYALGHIGTPAAIKQLEVMVDDPDAGTRYNAAVALAHRGNVKSIDTLTEMLDMNEQAGVRDEKDEGKQFKRTVLIVSAIDAAHALARQNPKANLAPIISALEQIASADKETLEKANVAPRVVVRRQGRAGPVEGREVVTRTASSARLRSAFGISTPAVSSVSVVPTMPSAPCSKTQLRADHPLPSEQHVGRQ